MNRIKITLAQNGTLMALVVLIVIFSIANPRFFSLINAQTILLQIAELGILALPVAFLVMSGTLDLSVGSVASLSAVVSAQVMAQTQAGWIGIVAGLVVGAVAGAVNGFLIAYLRLNALVITLGFLSVWGGLALFLTNGTTVADLPNEFRAIGTMGIGPLSLQVALLILGIAAAWFILNRSAIGRNVLAIGGNAKAAHLMGVNVDRTRFWLFVVTGMTASLAGILLSAKLQSAPPAVGATMEVQVLTVVLLGGVALEGGMGRISGVVAGLLFVGVLRNGLVILGVSQFLQTILIGATLVLAVMFDGGLRSLLKNSWSQLGIAAARNSNSAHVQADSDADLRAKAASH